jgi:Holliday junction resolvasome RuvABC endonuclease subunit
MNTLALDLGTKMGWCMRIGTQPLWSGYKDFKNGKFDGAGIRFVKFTRWLDVLLGMAEGRIDYVCFEAVRNHLGVDAAHAYGGFFAHLTAWCELHGIPYEGTSVQSIKIAVTGKGNSPKEIVMAEVARFGHLTADDNEADAIALMVWAMKSGKAGPIEGIQFKRPRSRLKSLQPVKQKRAVPGRPIRRKK